MTLQKFLHALRETVLITEVQQVNDLKIATEVLEKLVPGFPSANDIESARTAMRMLLALDSEKRTVLFDSLNKLYREKYFLVTEQNQYSASLKEVTDVVLPLLDTTKTVDAYESEFGEYFFQLGAKHAAVLLTKAIDHAFDRAAKRMNQINGPGFNDAMAVLETFFRASPVELDTGNALFEKKKA